jgi:K+/H+ antiporter YhaU regulatory subunit KhtT
MAIRSAGRMIVAPGGDDVIHEGDVVVVIGQNDNLQRFKRL